MADSPEKGGDEAEHLKGGTPAGQVFILRLWEDHGRSGRWAGRVQHVLRGDARSFAGLEMLTDCLASMLHRLTGEHNQDPAQRPGEEAALDNNSVPPPESRHGTRSHIEEKGAN